MASEPTKGQSKRHLKRHLIRWNEALDKKLLLCVQSVCNQDGLKIPWAKVGALMNDHNTGGSITEGAIVQHLAKTRNRMIEEALPVPPPLKRGGKNVISTTRAANNTATSSGLPVNKPARGRKIKKTPLIKRDEDSDSDSDGDFHDGPDSDLWVPRSRLAVPPAKRSTKSLKQRVVVENSQAREEIAPSSELGAKREIDSNTATVDKPIIDHDGNDKDYTEKHGEKCDSENSDDETASVTDGDFVGDHAAFLPADSVADSSSMPKPKKSLIVVLKWAKAWPNHVGSRGMAEAFLIKAGIMKPAGILKPEFPEMYEDLYTEEQIKYMAVAPMGFAVPPFQLEKEEISDIPGPERLSNVTGPTKPPLMDLTLPKIHKSLGQYYYMREDPSTNFGAGNNVDSKAAHSYRMPPPALGFGPQGTNVPTRPPYFKLGPQSTDPRIQPPSWVAGPQRCNPNPYPPSMGIGPNSTRPPGHPPSWVLGPLNSYPSQYPPILNAGQRSIYPPAFQTPLSVVPQGPSGTPFATVSIQNVDSHRDKRVKQVHFDDNHVGRISPFPHGAFSPPVPPEVGLRPGYVPGGNGYQGGNIHNNASPALGGAVYVANTSPHGNVHGDSSQHDNEGYLFNPDIPADFDPFAAEEALLHDNVGGDLSLQDASPQFDSASNGDPNLMADISPFATQAPHEVHTQTSATPFDPSAPLSPTSQAQLGDYFREIDRQLEGQQQQDQAENQAEKQQLQAEYQEHQASPAQNQPAPQPEAQQMELPAAVQAPEPEATNPQVVVSSPECNLDEYFDFGGFD